MSDVPGCPRLLVITNDFPPRLGGTQQYVGNLVAQLPADRVRVFAPAWEGAAAHDAALPFEVIRHHDTSIWPTPSVARTARGLARDAEVVLFGHGLPLGLLGPALARRGVPYLVCTHGTEFWHALVPGSAVALHRATSRASRVFSISRAMARVIRTAVPAHVPMSWLPPGVDVERFDPSMSGEPARERFGLGRRPVIVSVSRLVPRKGHDVLLRAMPRIHAATGAVLLIGGTGPYERSLRALAGDAPAGSVVFAGAIAAHDLAGVYAAADVVAVPCRNRFLGLEQEGFGIVFLEAAAAGKASVAGRSGGVEEAVVDGATGVLVDPGDLEDVSRAVIDLLGDPVRAAAMGRAGRRRAEERFAWPYLADVLVGHLRTAVERPGPTAEPVCED